MIPRRQTELLWALVVAIALGACTPRAPEPEESLARRMEKLDRPGPERRALEDRVATTRAAIPLMRAEKRTSSARGTTIEWTGYFSGESLVYLHQVGREAGGGGSDDHWFFDGRRVYAAQSRADYAPDEKRPRGMRLETEVLAGFDGRIVHARFVRDGLPLEMPPERQRQMAAVLLENGARMRGVFDLPPPQR